MCWLRPWAIVDVRGRRAVVVEWHFLKPCWVGLAGRDSVRDGRRSLSSILTAGLSREMGR